MTHFRRLTYASVVATFVLVSIGGLVRATKSGLGCGTDWPGCSGRLVPSLQTRAEVIEFSHRAAASVVVVLLAALWLEAMARRSSEPRFSRPAAAAFGLVLLQAAIGAVVVRLELAAASVVLHLAAALALLAVLVYLAGAVMARSGTLQGDADATTARRATWAAAAVLALLLVGSYLSGVGAERNAGFPDWPLVNGTLIPDLGVTTVALHWLHRLLAVAVGGVVLFVAVGVMKRKDLHPHAARLAHIAAGAFLVEILIGAANVWTQENQAINSAFVTAHLALGALIWGSVVGIAVVTHPAVHSPVEHRERVRRAALGVES